MRVDNSKPSKNFKDFTWIPDPDKAPMMLQYLLYGAPDYEHSYKPVKIRDSYLTSPDGDMSRYELEMVKSGASFKDIMFMRALEQQNKGGFSPYFNPNYKSKNK